MPTPEQPIPYESDDQPQDDSEKIPSDQGFEWERPQRAQALGLPEDASWAEIFEALNEQERQSVATALDLPLEASWRHILSAALNLSYRASAEEIIAKVQSIRKNLLDT